MHMQVVEVQGCAQHRLQGRWAAGAGAMDMSCGRATSSVCAGEWA